MFETFLLILLAIVSLSIAFVCGRIWNEKPRHKRVVRVPEEKLTQEAMIGEFASELKKRTRALRHYSHGIDKKNPTSEELAKLEKISTRMDGMLNLFVAYAKLSDVEMEESPISLEEAAQRALREMRSKGETLPKVTLPNLQTCLGDPQLLKQFFIVLFRNVTAADGRTTIEMGGLDGERKGLGKFYLNIKFPATGIDSSNPFILYNNHRTSAFGSGRGLAFCKKIINLHGGNLWCQSGHDQSLTFWYSIPVAISAMAKK